jgi:hypothetical protein
MIIRSAYIGLAVLCLSGICVLARLGLRESVDVVPMVISDKNPWKEYPDLTAARESFPIFAEKLHRELCRHLTTDTARVNLREVFARYDYPFPPGLTLHGKPEKDYECWVMAEDRTSARPVGFLEFRTIASNIDGLPGVSKQHLFKFFFEGGRWYYLSHETK